MTKPRTLRPYQAEAVDAVTAYWGTLDRERYTPVVVLPTGTGKSTVIAKLAVDAHYAGLRVLMLAHRRELLDQMAASVNAVAPDLTRVGIVQGERNSPTADIVAASFQTLTANPARLDALGRREVVLVDECFVAGTLVDGVPIQNIRPGDMVTAVSPSGDVTTRRVVRTMRSTPSALVKVSLSTGESFVCTPGHPFLTPDGWCPAGKLSNGVQLHHAQASRESSPLHSVRETGGHDTEAPTGYVVPEQKGVLLNRVPGPVRKEDAFRDDVADQPQVCLGTNAEEQPYAPGRCTEESVRVAQTNGAPTEGSRWERQGDNRATASAIRGAWVAHRSSDLPARRAATISLQGGHCAPESETVRGNRWHEPQHRSSPRTGSTQGPAFGRVRVDNVTFLEPGSDGRYGGLCPDGYVYNLEVDTDHTYTVGSGVTVHNCHHSAAETYKGVLDALDVTSHNPNNPVFACGFTATASRADGGLDGIWDNVVYEKSLSWAIKKGYLVTPRGLTVVLPDMDLTEVAVRAGDYAAGELEHVMQASVDTTVMAMLTHAAGRASIVFAAGVDHAEALAAALSAHGVAAAAVTGAMSAEARGQVYEAFNDGELDAMVTVQVLTEGADFPRCDAVVMARPTRSQTLYSQMVGRALRLYPGKDDALVLDLAGVTRDMSLVTLSDLTTEATTARVAPDSDDDPGQDEPAPRPERKQRIGVAALEDIDLLAVSPANWLTTPKGVRFLDVGNKAIIFLWPPHPEGSRKVMVGVMHTPPDPNDRWLYDGYAGELADAIKAAEHAAEDYGQLPPRNAPWRNRSAPSAAQVRLAKTLGVDHADDKTRARLSDDISTALAARRLDPFVS